jgi:enamine deaminase RidA (YjgF/YER057c/UK114 family)
MTTKIVAMAGIVLLVSCNRKTEMPNNPEVMKNTGKTEFLNPETLSKNPAFSQVAVVSGSNRTIYIGGQDAIDRDGKLVGKGNLEQQAQQVLTNIEAALTAGGARSKASLERLVTCESAAWSLSRSFMAFD